MNKKYQIKKHMKPKTKPLTVEQIMDKGLIPCDNYEDCHNLATYNLQDAVIKWNINKEGDYAGKLQFIDNIGDINEHLCDTCESECGY